MIINKTKKTIIAKNEMMCTSIFSKFLGLMFCSKIKTPLVFAFKKEESVPLHMFFVFCNIDVIFVDKNKKVVDVKENFRPFTTHYPMKKAKFVIETCSGTIKKTNTAEGDEIDFLKNHKKLK